MRQGWRWLGSCTVGALQPLDHGLILGLVGGVGCYLAVDLIRVKLQIDDSLDVFAVHGVGGILGSLLVAFLALPIFGGLGLGEGVSAGAQFMVQLKSVVITVIWTAIASAYEELSKLNPSAIIELFEVHLDSALHGSTDVYRFHAGANAAVSGNVVFNGNTYTRIPVKADGFDFTNTGTLPRPTLSISNLDGVMTTLLLLVNTTTAGNDLGGAEVRLPDTCLLVIRQVISIGVDARSSDS